MVKNAIKKIERLLPRAMASDRAAIRRSISRIKRSGDDLTNDNVQKKLLGFENRLNTSIKKKLWRKEHRPEPSYNFDLPITSKKDEIIQAILSHQILIISGETGSGKTTQIPKFCLAAGRGIDGKIGCTQPRRIAATTVARRIAAELGEDLGKSVGYKIRFDDQTGGKAFIKMMTDGILLAETQYDPFLTEYDTLIVDEAHERSLNIDFVLGILKSLLKKRKDLKLIITSATIDTEKFSHAFENAPVIEVSGRMYPVAVEHFPSTPEAEKNGEQTHLEMAVNAVAHLQAESSDGDVLVFMPTEQDIREICELIDGRRFARTTVLPLYGRLSASEQSRVFSSMTDRKIIVATNVAETSITIPGIKYVIDTGLARISQYTPKSRTTSLPVLPISRSSADQRKGRCGRIENGICIRLFSEEDFLSRPLFTPPEILRSNLAEVILRMIALNLGDVFKFPFIDRPNAKSIRDGFDLLTELGAILPSPEKKGPKGKAPYLLSTKGRLMAKIPVDPRLSRMLIEAQKEGCLEEITIIASALSIRDPRERPAEKTEEVDRIHATFSDPSSDFITLLNIWNRYQDTRKKEKSTARMKKFCRANYLSFQRMREWLDIHSQISTILEGCGIRKEEPRERAGNEVFSPLYAAIHRSILSGFLSNIAMKKAKNIFKATKGREAMLFPGSGLFNKAGEWIVAAEMIATTRIFARTAANIDSIWLETLGQEQCKYTYLRPHWGRTRGEVVAYEQVSLYGFIIVPQRPVSYGRINPEEASDIFIRYALVEGDVKKPFPFMTHNQKLIREVEDMENRIRRRDLMVSEEEMVKFYKNRLKGIYDLKTLQKLLKKQGDDKFLRMKKENLLAGLPDQTELSLFPDRINLGEKSFACTYRFDPEKDDDGVTVKIPSRDAYIVPFESTEWVVPGLLREKITSLIKGLPKSYRKKLVPVASTVDVIVKELPKKEGSLITALSQFIYNRFGVGIPASAWPYHTLPNHLQMRIALIGPNDEVIHSARDSSILSQSISCDIGSKEFESARKTWEKTSITQWDFDDLPETITLKSKDGIKWTVYPGLKKVESQTPGVEQINLSLFRQRDEAITSHKQGIAALFTIHFAKDLKFLKKKLTLPSETRDRADYFGGPKRIEKKLYDRVIMDSFCRNIRTQKAFKSHAQSIASDIFANAQKKLNRVIILLDAYHQSRSTLYRLEQANSGNRGAINFLKNIRVELSRLVPETFVDRYDTDQMVHIERYIQALTIRAQRGVLNFEKDQARANELQPYTDKLEELMKTLSPSVSDEKKKAIEAYFWLIEEYKVSLFAQELKTALPVSKKRLNQKLKEIDRMI